MECFTQEVNRLAEGIQSKFRDINKLISTKCFLKYPPAKKCRGYEFRDSVL